MQDFRRLRVIRGAREVLVLAYRVTAAFPRAERFGFVSQMRRSALGIGSNIAEGCGRSSNAAFRVSLDRAMGETSELEFQCVAAGDLGLGNSRDLDRLMDAVIREKMSLASLIVSVRKRQGKNDDEGQVR
jgi:four helix bundle protein